MKKLNLTIKHSDGDRELHLSADNMNELIDKIIDWQTMDDASKKIYKQKRKLKNELNSGWYYINKSK